MIPCRTSRLLKVDEIHSATEINDRKISDGLITKIWDTFINPPTSSTGPEKEYEEYKYKDEPEHVLPDIEDTVDTNVKLLNQQPAYDKIIKLEVYHQLGKDMIFC